jgi:hypothetical protein
MKTEKMCDDDVPFKTWFAEAFKVKGGSMKTKGVRKSKAKAKDKTKEKDKVKDKSSVKWKDQEETNDKSAMSEVRQDDQQD